MSEEKSVFDLGWVQDISNRYDVSIDFSFFKTKLTGILDKFRSWIENEKHQAFVRKTLSQQADNLVLYFTEIQLTLPIQMVRANIENTSTISLGYQLSASLHDEELLFIDNRPHILETIRQHVSLEISKSGKSIDFLVYPGKNGPIYTQIDPVNDPDGISTVLSAQQVVDKLKEFLTTNL